MNKKLLLLFFIVFMAVSCGGPNMEYALSDKYRSERPYTLAVLPVEWASDAPDKLMAVNHFRAMTNEKLIALGYRLVPLAAVDGAYRNNGPDGASDEVKARIAEKSGADGLVHIHIVNWDVAHIGSYASLNIEAVFSIYSKKGELIWSSSYKTSESDMSFDPEAVDVAVVKAYEPRILRLVESIFATLPQAERPAPEKTFFEWLP